MILMIFFTERQLNLLVFSKLYVKTQTVLIVLAIEMVSSYLLLMSKYEKMNDFNKFV